MADQIDPGQATGIVATALGLFASVTAAIKYFASSADVDRLRKDFEDHFMSKAEAAEKFATQQQLKDALDRLMENVHYIRTRLDQLLDRKDS